MELNIILKIIAALLHLIGWVYAVQILHTPVKHGWTFISVMTGTLIIALGEMSVYLILYYADALTIDRVIFVPIAVLVLVGAPMAILQIIKKVREDRKNNDIDEENFDK